MDQGDQPDAGLVAGLQGVAQVQHALGQAAGGALALLLTLLDQDRGPSGVPGRDRGRPGTGERVEDCATGRAGVADQELQDADLASRSG